MIELIKGGTPEQQQVMQRIYERDGNLTVAAVLTEARKKTSPLHSEFEWNDKAAAARFRETQAGALIGRFRIVRVTDDRVLDHRQYLRDERDRTYSDVREVMTSQDLYDQQKLQLMTELRRIQARLARFDEFAELTAAIGAALGNAA